MEHIVIEDQTIEVLEETTEINLNVVEDNVVATIIETEIINVEIIEATGEPGAKGEDSTVPGPKGDKGDKGDKGEPGAGSDLTVVNLDGTSETTRVKTIKLDQSTGIKITNSEENEVTIGLGSGFKTWKVSGQEDLIAEGEDTIEIIAGANVTIETDQNSNPKSITISSTGGGGTGSYLKLDQTEPQRISGGAPTFENGIIIVEGQKLIFNGE